MRGLFITGTDTGVGKTYVAAAIVRACRAAGIRVGAYKPVCTGREADRSGNEIWPDVAALGAALDHACPAELICPQRFAAPLAPPSAARLETRSVDRQQLRDGITRWRDQAELLIVEGVGGLLCPLTDEETVADFAAETGFPLVIVAALKLGAINHTLLTVEVARQRGLPIAGLLLNELRPEDDSQASGIAEITARSPVPILGVLPFQKAVELRPGHVISTIDWWNLATVPTGPLQITSRDPLPEKHDRVRPDVE